MMSVDPAAHERLAGREPEHLKPIDDLPAYPFLRVPFFSDRVRVRQGRLLVRRRPHSGMPPKLQERYVYPYLTQRLAVPLNDPTPSSSPPSERGRRRAFLSVAILSAGAVALGFRRTGSPVAARLAELGHGGRHRGATSTPGCEYCGSSSDGSSSNASEAIATWMGCEGFEKMALGCAAALSLNAAALPSNGAYELAIKYSPTSDDAEYLWTSSKLIDGASSFATLPLYRLRALTEYNARVFVMEVGGEGEAEQVASANFTTGATGYSFFDAGTLATVAGRASFQVMLVDLASDTFTGVVMLDNLGYVVWYYDTGAEARGADQLAGTFSLAVTAEREGVMTLHHVSASGELLAMQSPSCTGTGEQWSALGDEARASRAARGGALAVVNDLDQFGFKRGYIVASHVTVWNVSDSSDATGGQLASLYDINDIVSPQEHWVHARNSMTQLRNLSCSGGKEPVDKALDWAHVSSVSESDDGTSLLVSLRNLDTVLCLARDGSGLRWAISASLPALSNFSFADEDAMFYDPREAVLSGDDALLLFDNGKNRPGCTSPWQKHCYSRAVKYHLNFARREAKVAWQFEFPLRDDGTHNASAITTTDAYVRNGGSLVQQGDLYYVGYTSARHDSTLTDATVFEVDGDGSIVSSIGVDRSFWSVTGGMYRALPLASVHGESRGSPLGR